MELRKLLTYYARYRLLLIVASFLGGIIGVSVSRSLPPVYSATKDVFVSRESYLSTDDYSYDGYYAQQVGRGLADNTALLMSSPSLLAQLFPESSSDTLKDLQKDISARVVSTNIVRVSVNRPSPAAAEATITQIFSGVGSQLKAISDDPQKVSFTPIGDFMVISETLPVWMYAGFGFFWGLLIALMYCSIRGGFLIRGSL